MSEEDKHKLSKILYYSDIHPADTEFINNIIYDLQQENKQLKKKYENAVADYELEKYKNSKAIEYIKENKENTEQTLDFDEMKTYNTALLKLLEILEDKDIEFDVLKALNTDLEDDVEMGW